jgi:hypothetical protein
MTPIMPSSLGAVLHPFSPPSARATIKVLVSLYEKTGEATYLEQIGAIISDVKQYNHIVKPKEPGYKSRRRATNPKWDCDIKNIHMYEFVYSMKEMSIESTAAMIEELLVTNPDFGNASYEVFLTPKNLKDLKYALLVSGESESYLYTEFKSLQCFLVKGCYLLHHREDHPVFRSRPSSVSVAPVVLASASRLHLENAITTEDGILSMLAQDCIATARILKADRTTPFQKLKAKGKAWKERLCQVEEEDEEQSTTDNSFVTQTVSTAIEEGESDRDSMVSFFDRITQKGSMESLASSSSQTNVGGLRSHVRRFMGSVVSFVSFQEYPL